MAWLAEATDHTIQQHYGGFGYASSLLQTQAMTCPKAIQWAVEHQQPHIRILTDSHVLVQMLKTETTSNIHIYWTTSRIRELAAQVTSCRVIKVSSDQVSSAKQLAC